MLVFCGKSDLIYGTGIFVGGKPYAKRNFLSGTRKNSGPLRSGPDFFFLGSLRQNTNFRPAQQNFPVQIYGTGNFFWGEALRKMQIFIRRKKKIRST